MAGRLEDGLPGFVDEGLPEAFPGVDRKALTLALAELKADGLVELSSSINIAFPHVRATYALFVAADPGVTGDDPMRDSVVLARLLIDDPQLGNIRKLEAAAGWPRRRFNPAVGQLVSLFPEGRTRNPIQNEYPVLGLIVGDDEVLALRRYVQGRTR